MRSCWIKLGCRAETCTGLSCSGVRLLDIIQVDLSWYQDQRMVVPSVYVLIGNTWDYLESGHKSLQTRSMPDACWVQPKRSNCFNTCSCALGPLLAMIWNCCYIPKRKKHGFSVPKLVEVGYEVHTSSSPLSTAAICGMLSVGMSR